MADRVTYELSESIATITMDDGKANALSPAMLDELNAAFDRAEADGAVVVLTGRDGRFSGGFDLGVLAKGGPDAADMLRSGFELAERMLAFPAPVVVACTGHVVAMGVFVLLSGDYRIGVAGPYKITANEVAIGMTMPRTAVEICRQRLTPAAFNRAVLLAEVFSPDDAVPAGFFDRVVEPSDLREAARIAATGFAALHRGAHTGSKRRLREPTLAAVRAGIEADDAEIRALMS